MNDDAQTVRGHRCKRCDDAIGEAETMLHHRPLDAAGKRLLRRLCAENKGVMKR
jgi:hypothetical protein